MSGQPQPPLAMGEDYDLGDTLDYQDYRSGGREQVRRRQEAVRRYELQVEVAANAEALYQKSKAARIISLKAEGLSGTEAVARVKGDETVAVAMIDRDLQAGKVKARLEDIATIDEASFHLRKVAEWSQKLLDLGPQQQGAVRPLRGAA